MGPDCCAMVIVVHALFSFWCTLKPYTDVPRIGCLCYFFGRVVLICGGVFFLVLAVAGSVGSLFCLYLYPFFVYTWKIRVFGLPVKCFSVFLYF